MIECDIMFAKLHLSIHLQVIPLQQPLARHCPMKNTICFVRQQLRWSVIWVLLESVTSNMHYIQRVWSIVSLKSMQDCLVAQLLLQKLQGESEVWHCDLLCLLKYCCSFIVVVLLKIVIYDIFAASQVFQTCKMPADCN